MIGKQILNYKITTQIGKGGMATVYEAIHIKLDTKVAIKVLDPILATNQTIYKRFVQEAKIMASLNHENITKVIDFDDQDKLAIVMEYLDGFTLNDYIKQKGALNKKEAITIFSKILEGFSYAHKKGIVHRDIKPSNIFITKGGKVKIMDFGIAKIIEDGANVLTQTGTQMGTPVYMSPEQVNDSKHINHLSDIYSLGVCLWFMLTGKPPYDAKTTSVFTIYKKIDTEPLAVLSNKELNAIVQKATEKEVDKRFGSCVVFIEALTTKNNRPQNPKKVHTKQTILEEEQTIFEPENKPKPKKTKPKKEPVQKTEKSNNWIYIATVTLVIIVAYFFINNPSKTRIEGNFNKKVQGIDLEMIAVKGGTFNMGSNEYEYEKPIHQVKLDDFYIAKYPVTQELWQAVMGNNPSYFQSKETSKHPVERVSWNDAQEFLKRLSKLTGKKYRLPTEAEWEYAARGGAKSKGYNYAGSNNLDEVAWYYENAHDKGEASPDYGTHQVGTKKANELGIYDMSGNVWEWCSDWYDKDYYKNSPLVNPQGAKKGFYRVFRGGGWDSDAFYCRVAFRLSSNPANTFNILGFRPVFLP